MRLIKLLRLWLFTLGHYASQIGLLSWKQACDKMFFEFSQTVKALSTSSPKACRLSW